MNELINIIGGVVTGAVLYLIYLAHKENRTEKRQYAPLVSADRSANYMQSKTFTVRDALNGQYIEFHKHQYNPNGPDTNEQCVYIVKDDESLLAAISVVLVLMDKEN